MSWNKYLRYGFRLPLLALPFGLFYNDFDDKFNQVEFLRRKYYSRLVRYQKTGDMKYMDPNGKLEAKFQEKMMG